jgi:hypothetical protein
VSTIANAFLNITGNLTVNGGTVNGGSGTLSATGTGNYVNNASISGYGTISAPGTNPGTITPDTHTLVISGGVTNNNLMNTVNGGILDIQSTVSGGTINPGNTVNLNNVTLAVSTLGPGTVNVQSGTNYLQGPTTSSATFNVSSTLNVTGVITNTGTGDVKVNDTGILNVAGTLGAVNFLMSQNAQLNVASGGLNLTGNFSFAQTDPLKWSWADGTTLQLAGGTSDSPEHLMVGGTNYGAGTNQKNFDNSNFDLTNLALTYSAYVQLMGDTGKALYVDSLSLPSGTTLDLHGFDLYVWNSSLDQYQIALMGDKAYGLGTITDSSTVPLPLAPGCS